MIRAQLVWAYLLGVYMNKKIIYLLTACLLLGACVKEDTGTKNKPTDKNTIIVNSTKQEKISLDESGAKDLVFENLYFDDKNLDQIMDFFKDYNIDFEKSESHIRDFVADAKNNIYDGEKYGYDWAPQTPYLGNYVFNDRLNVITTSLEDGKSDLEVYSKGLNEDPKVYTLIENINYLEPLYTYDGDKLYYSSDTADGRSILGVFNLDDFKNEKLLENILKVEDGKVTGDLISLVTKLDGKIVCQVSHYDGQSIRDDKPNNNKLVYIDDPSKEIDIGENNFDVFEKVGNYYISHDRGYGEEERFVKIYDKDFKLLYKTKEPMDRLVGVTKLEKDGKTYLLLSDGMWTHYIVDPENNKESYQLNGIDNADRNFWYNIDKFVLSDENVTYIGKDKN